MPILNVVCPICTEVFKNADDIYSTSCGHIFHFSCVQDWMGRSTSCPKCRQYNPTTHKLYLSFDDSEESLQKLQEIELKLKSSNEKNAQLADQMNETEFNFLHLQEQFTACEREKRDLEEKIRQIGDSDKNFLHLQGQYTESSELVKELQDQIQILRIDNECKSKELSLKNLEIDSLKAGLQTEQSPFSDSILNDKIRVLEQKLKHISAEFEKEIAISTQLSIDKMKLESYIKHLKSADFNTKGILKHTNNEDLSKKRENQKIVNPINDLLNKNSNQISDSSDTFVFIKDLPLDQLVIPFENIIIKLASKMSLQISADDLVKVNIVDDKKQPSSKAQLVVQFKNKLLKNNFLANKNLLKNDPTTSSIIVGEYMDDQLHALLIYAKEKLRNNGYKHVFYKNNQIFAKKHRSHPKVIRIHNKDHVDSLQNKKKLVEPEAAVSPAIVTECKIDENYYQI
ncbi:kinectin-like [Lucilia sericata]|uniref:kinectin-like n=1 Tax=Lucilia sericata TaxID=13632 RepID=UPI0018A816AB|nr:kinectin-like [Lucilia sericata]